MMSKAVDTWDEKIRPNWRENVDSVLLHGTGTAALTDPSLSHEK